MNALRLTPAALLAAIISACVTINVYFPAVAAERAADRIINDVWGDMPPAPNPPPAREGEPSAGLDLPQRMGLVAVRALELVIPVAHAQADLDISSPAIRSIVGSMENRHAQLKPLYDSGAIGLSTDALLAMRDLNAVPLAGRNQARKLVADENADRNALYKEIAVANGHPEWEAEIRQTFAKRWVDKAQSGWWYQAAGGAWKQK